MARRNTKARICLTGTLAASMVLGLATGTRDAWAVVTEVKKKKDLLFGIISVEADLGGTVVVSPAGAKSVTGGVIDLGGTHKKADVQVKGDPDTSYSCDPFPASIVVTSGGNSATVDTFLTETPFSGTLDGKGKAKFKIGATLRLPAGQPAGDYSGSFDFTCEGFSDTVLVTATLWAPISISVGANMEFGTMLTTGTAGTVTVTPAGARSSVNVDLFGGLPSAASFDVTGESGQIYSITLPSSATLTSGANTMTVDTYTDDAGVPPTLAGGSDTFNVGATLNVGAAQAAGTYSGTFTVTVNYN